MNRLDHGAARKFLVPTDGFTDGRLLIGFSKPGVDALPQRLCQ